MVLAGTAISLATKRYIPETVFAMDRPVLGFVSGLAFLVATLSVFAAGGHAFVVGLRWMDGIASSAGDGWLHWCLAVLSWVSEVVLVKTTFSLQLLCTIALQMARFLERSQLAEARAQLAWLCSRDPTHLNAEELAGGTLESLSVSLWYRYATEWFLMQS